MGWLMSPCLIVPPHRCDTSNGTIDLPARISFSLSSLLKCLGILITRPFDSARLALDLFRTDWRVLSVNLASLQQRASSLHHCLNGEVYRGNRHYNVCELVGLDTNLSLHHPPCP